MRTTTADLRRLAKRLRLEPTRETLTLLSRYLSAWRRVPGFLPKVGHYENDRGRRPLGRPGSLVRALRVRVAKEFLRAWRAGDLSAAAVAAYDMGQLNEEFGWLVILHSPSIVAERKGRLLPLAPGQAAGSKRVKAASRYISFAQIIDAYFASWRTSATSGGSAEHKPDPNRITYGELHDAMWRVHRDPRHRHLTPAEARKQVRAEYHNLVSLRTVQRATMDIITWP